jgi:hypothetical protein
MSTQTAPPTDGVFGTTTQTPTAPVTEHHTPVPMNVIVDQSLMGVQPSLGSIETAEDSVSRPCLFIFFWPAKETTRTRRPRAVFSVQHLCPTP